MVCVKKPESTHDFKTDPLKLRIVDGWLYATDTTLGADNGMGVALAMVAACDPNIKHGPLELLFTSDEEIGLIGASGMKTCLKSKFLLNLDSEEFGEICVSCAGGFRITYDKKFSKTLLGCEQCNNGKTVKLTIDNYLGGHSGVEINLFRANAVH